MSVLACVTIYECDDCKTTFAVKSDKDLERFEESWDSGCYHDFCPKCKDKPENLHQIKTDSEIFKNAVSASAKSL